MGTIIAPGSPRNAIGIYNPLYAWKEFVLCVIRMRKSWDMKKVLLDLLLIQVFCPKFSFTYSLSFKVSVQLQFLVGEYGTSKKPLWTAWSTLNHEQPDLLFLRTIVRVIIKIAWTRIVR